MVRNMSPSTPYYILDDEAEECNTDESDVELLQYGKLLFC